MLRRFHPPTVAALMLPALLAVPARPADAQVVTLPTVPIVVTATVLKLCVVAALPLAFGNYSSAADLTGQTTITVTCTPGTAFTVGLDAGAGTGATTATRRMSLPLGGGTLNYSLYQDSAFSRIWGSTGAELYSGTGTVLAQAIPVYGRIPANQVVPAGLYTDTVNVTLVY